MQESPTPSVIDELCTEAAADAQPLNGGQKNRVPCDSWPQFIGESLDQPIERGCKLNSVNDSTLANVSRNQQYAAIRALITLEEAKKGLSTFQKCRGALTDPS